MDTQSIGSGTILLGCPHSKQLAMEALNRREGPEVLAGEPQEEENRGCSVQNHCTEQVSLTCLLFKKIK